MLKQRVSKSFEYAQDLLRIDLKYYLKSGFWISLSNFWTLGAQLLVSFAYANFLPIYIFGIYKYITSTAAILGSVTLTGMNTAITQAVANGKTGTFHKSIKYQLKWNVIYLAASCLMGSYYFIQNNHLLGFAFVILGIIQPLSFVGNTYIAYLHGIKDFQKFSKYSIATVSVTSFFTIVAAYFFQNVIILLLANFGITMLFNILWLIICLKRADKSNVDLDSIKYGRHLSYNNVLSTIASYSDYILVYHLLGPESLAIYAFATLLPDTLRSLSKNISQAALPRLAGEKTQGYFDNIPRKSLILLSILGLMTATYYFISPFIINLIFPQYHSMIKISQIYSLSLLASVNIIPVTLMLAKKKSKQIYTFTITGSAVQIALIVILIPLFGIYGAIAAKMLAHATNLLTSYIIVYSSKKTYEQ